MASQKVTLKFPEGSFVMRFYAEDSEPQLLFWDSWKKDQSPTDGRHEEIKALNPEFFENWDIKRSTVGVHTRIYLKPV